MENIFQHTISDQLEVKRQKQVIERDESRVIASLDKPLLQANKHERSGYTPNVVYTCGATCITGGLLSPTL